MGKKGYLSDLQCSMVVGDKLSVSETVDLLRVSHTAISRAYRERFEKEKISSKRQFSGRKCQVVFTDRGE